MVAIYTAHPQANGLVERYNGVIKNGLRMMARVAPTTPWTEHLPQVLAGLRFLPTRLGYPPAWVVYKQDVQGLPEALGVGLGGEGCIEEAGGGDQEKLIKEQGSWWEATE